MKRHQADIFVVLALFCVYAASAILLCAIGAGIYQNTSQIMEENYNARTSSLYVAEKIRQGDVNGAVEVRQLDGSDALVLIEQESGEFFETWIYVHDDTLCEAFIPAGTEVNYQLGQEIMPILAMQLTQTPQGLGSLLQVDFTMPDGSNSGIDLYLKSQAGDF